MSITRSEFSEQTAKLRPCPCSGWCNACIKWMWAQMRAEGLNPSIHCAESVPEKVLDINLGN